MDIIEKIVATFERRGDEIYAGEDVTQLQHATQCARLAKMEDASDSLVVAALLHDIGHIIGDNDLPSNCRENLDDSHEEAGHEFLKRHFADNVVSPVRLHVAAKRYLCTVDEAYINQLSPVSLKSLSDQGGLMSSDEREEFESNPHHQDAVRLRKWDDLAKDSELPDLSVDDYLAAIKRVLKQPSATSGQTD